MTEITMPRLADSMEEGTILKWLKTDGQSVICDEELVEIETDKATMTHPAPADGMLEIIAPEGATLAVGEPIARISAAVHASPGPNEDKPMPKSTAKLASTPDAAAPVPATSSTPPPPAADAVSAPAAATPLARRFAHVHEVPLEGIHGTGPRGRVTRADVLRAVGAVIAQPLGVAPPTPVAPHTDGPAADGAGGADSTGATRAKGDTHRVDPSRLQQVVARRMAEAKATIPHFQVQTEVAMNAAIDLRTGLKASANGERIPSLNDLVVKACGIALRQHPRANGSYKDGGFELHSRINIGVAVAADDALVVPVVNDADARSLGGIARETQRLAERVRSGAVGPPELSGGTFTVSNLGMYGMTAIMPVINPPQAAILGVGALRDTLARVGGHIVDRTVMTLTLSCDHRILYGADAALLLAEIRSLLESPLGLAL
jgi:pyruvate dehydrogenase E2 component (dihydrolipoamide acetyltransferase)